MRAPFRIRRPIALAATPAGGDSVGGWLERLVRLVPSEILAVYLAGRGHAHAIPGVWPLICLALLLVIRVWGTREPPKGPQWLAILVAAISFVIWVFATGGQVLDYRLDADTASLLVLVWTTVVPVIYKGD